MRLVIILKCIVDIVLVIMRDKTLKVRRLPTNNLCILSFRTKA